jgi:Uma2 family endonuclease
MITSEPIYSLPKTPPLENGDQLSRQEFERRYQNLSEIKKAELIEGIVYISSPVRVQSHGEPHSDILTWLGVYKAATIGVMSADNTTVRLDADNEVQPDALLRIKIAGQSTISDDDYIEGAPELIVEIAASSASYDLHNKWRVYRRNLDWFRLNAGEYIKLEPDSRGIIYSQVFPGLWLDVNALLGGNLGQVLTVLQQGLASQEHQDFLKILSQKK